MKGIIMDMFKTMAVTAIVAYIATGILMAAKFWFYPDMEWLKVVTPILVMAAFDFVVMIYTFIRVLAIIVKGSR